MSERSNPGERRRRTRRRTGPPAGRGFSYSVTDEQIREWIRFPVRQKLRWLEEANRFNEKILRGRTLKIWEAFRAGRI